MRNYYLLDIEFQFGMRKALEMNSGDGCTTLCVCVCVRVCE